jgi:hypothetical protein
MAQTVIVAATASEGSNDDWDNLAMACFYGFGTAIASTLVAHIFFGKLQALGKKLQNVESY